jgi:peptidoglycan/xylan/chitin deacetylase (PgdA/CDA1 family)
MFGAGFIVALGVLFSSSLASAAGANLVANGDFEAGSGSAPTGWTKDYWGTNTRTFTYPVAGNGSAKAAKVQLTKYTSGDVKWMFNHIPVTPGATYTYSEDYNSNVATNITIEYKKSNGSYSYVWVTDPASTANAWKTFTTTITPPAGVVSMSVLHVLQKVGSLTLDNVSVTDGSTAPPPPPQQKPVIASFSADPASITSGQSSTLSWSVTNASSTSIDQNIGVVTGTSKTVVPTQTLTYTLTATNPAGSVSTTATVTVTQPQPPPPLGPKPSISSFAANPAAITSGQSSTLSWTVVNASSTSITNIGAVTGSSKSVSPAQTTQYVLTATNPNGSASATTTVTVTQPQPPPAGGNNLIQNGNLEAGSGSAPNGWSSDHWGSLKATFTYPVAGNGGGKAAKVVVSNWKSGDAKWWFNHVAVSPDTIYTFTDDYMSNVVSNVTVEFKMSDGSYQYQWVANAPVASSWTPLSAEITVPRGAVSLSVLHALDKNGTLTIDNASLVALPSNPFPQGMVTLVFDDGLTSQYNNARSILTSAGIKATFAIITQGVRDINGDKAAMTWAQIHTIENDGNEIASHSRTHPDLSTLSASAAQAEIQGSMSDLIAKGFSPKTFVYPVGGENPAVEAMVEGAGYAGARGSYWGLNSPTANRWALYDVRYDKATTAAQINAMIDQAVSDKRWLILEIHDVLPSGGDDYAITPSKLQSVVTHIQSSGIKAVTLEEGMALMQ